jgi:octaprenyl-diphosphate synthase
MPSVNVDWNTKTIATDSSIGMSEQKAMEDYAYLLSLIIDDIAGPLGEVEALLRDQLSTEDSVLQPLLNHVLTLGGKRLRPMLTLLAAKASGGITRNAIRLAVAVELVHTATLVHDDILDNADHRRHRPSLHRAFDAQSSLLVGDWLFTQAYYLANQTSSTVPGLWLAQAAKAVCEGEIRQTLTAGDLSITTEQYLVMLAKKTGSLCAVACELGAWSAGAATTTCEAFNLFGLKLGQAFQVHDDYLDYWGDSSKLGKPIGQDFAAGKATLPLIRWLELQNSDSNFLAGNLRERFTFEEMVDEMDREHIQESTRDVAIQLSREAQALLTTVSTGHPNSVLAGLDSLVKLAKASVQRSA